MVVEDDAGLRQLIQRALARAGYEAAGAASGVEAIEKAAEDSGLVLVLDLQLPDMPGREIVAALSARGMARPFVVMTGQGDERQAVAMMKMGASDYLVKDTELADRLPGVLDRVFRTLETERRLGAAEDALRESEQRFRGLFQSVRSVAVRGYGMDGTTRYWNHAAETIYGYREEEAAGRSLLDLIVPPEKRRDAQQALKRMVETGQAPPPSEESMVRKDGTRVAVFCSPVVVRVPGFEAEWFSIDVDLTERNRAKKELEHALARNTALLDANPDLMFLFDGDGRIVDFHAQHPDAELYCPPEEFLGKPCEAVLPPEVAGGGLEKIREVLATGRPAFYTYALGTGDVVHHYECRYVLCGTNQVLAFVRDVTERKLMEEEREKLQGQLAQAQKLESIGRLAGGVAHDFNNMLAVIMGNVEMALEGMAADKPLYAELQEVRKAAQRSSDLTRQLLAFARKQTVTPKVLDVNDVVEGTLKILRRLIGEHIALEWRPGESVGPVKMDPSQIDQILVNLCVNARDALGDRGRIGIETGETTVGKSGCAGNEGGHPGRFVRLAVEDNGCGMDAETRAHAFEPFFTTKPVGQGTGLGLATVYGIVQQNGGFIEIDSAPGKGTRIEINLPRHKAQKDAPTAEPGGGYPAGSRKTILLVEDEPAILSMVRSVLERWDYRVLPADSPGKALRLAEARGKEIDLLLTDVVMPEMNGRELSERLAEKNPGMRRLFMSGHTADILAQHGVLEKNVHFIQKPFVLKELATKVASALSDA